MEITPLSSNRVFIKIENGISITISDDGSYITIQRVSHPHRPSSDKIRGIFYGYEEHFKKQDDKKFTADVVRIDK